MPVREHRKNKRLLRLRKRSKRPFRRSDKSRPADEQGVRRLGREGHENESVASQPRTGERDGNWDRQGQLAEGQEPCGGHSRLQFKLWISQTVEEGVNSHVLGMNPSVAGPNIREAEAN